jgi:hypothetical protein
LRSAASLTVYSRVYNGAACKDGHFRLFLGNACPLAQNLQVWLEQFVAVT